MIKNDKRQNKKENDLVLSICLVILFSFIFSAILATMMFDFSQTYRSNPSVLPSELANAINENITLGSEKIQYQYKRIDVSGYEIILKNQTNNPEENISIDILDPSTFIIIATGYRTNQNGTTVIFVPDYTQNHFGIKFHRSDISTFTYIDERDCWELLRDTVANPVVNGALSTIGGLFVGFIINIYIFWRRWRYDNNYRDPFDGN